MLIKDYVKLKLNKIKELEEKIKNIKQDPIMSKHYEFSSKLKQIKYKLEHYFQTFPGVTTLTEEAKKWKKDLEEKQKKLDVQYDLWQYTNFEDPYWEED